MDYKKIIDEIEEMCGNNFTTDSFQTARTINRQMNKSFNSFSTINKERELNNFLKVKSYLEDVVFYKLKEKLGYDDEVIRKLVSYLNFSGNIEEVYVIDGYTAVKIGNDGEININSSNFIPEGNFSDISSLDYNDSDGNLVIKKLVVNGINNFFRERFNNEDVLVLKNSGYISNNIPGLYIFINSSLSHLNEINEKHIAEVAKMLVKYGDDIYYFDVKIRDNYLIFHYNDFEINKIFELLNTQNKIKSARM